MFHGLCTQVPGYALFPGGRTCLLKVDDFSKLVAWCSKNFDILRLKDLNEYLITPTQKLRPLILTFDDGLASVIDLALPILKDYRASALVFVTTMWTDSGRTPDIFLLERALWNQIPANLTLNINDNRLNFDITSRASAAKVLTCIWGFLFKIHFPPLNITAENILINGKPLERQEVPEDRYFWFPASWEELRAAAQAGWLEIGSHMVSHIPLSWLSDEDKLFQLCHSRNELSRILGVPIISCSHPHGPINQGSITMAENIYDWSFTNKPGWLNSKTRRGALPRYHVPGEAPEIIRLMLQWGRSISLFRKFGASGILKARSIFFPNLDKENKIEH
jgi:peptidoglycan/xylan/chitin deacetylase (PgdA/CDA1 family)